jgi:hypothetical protein
MRSIRKSGGIVRVLGLILVIVGYFGPWVPHKTAALTVTGWELAEFAKFFPQVQGGMVSIARELFYLPLVMVCMSLALLAGRSTARPARWIVPLLFAALLVTALLPYSVVDAARQAMATRAPLVVGPQYAGPLALVVGPQYAGQLALVVAGAALTLLIPLAGRLPRRLQDILIALLALAGAIPPLWQFALLHPLAVALYAVPIGLGWGLIGCAAGFVLLLLSGILGAASPDRAALHPS